MGQDLRSEVPNLIQRRPPRTAHLGGIMGTQPALDVLLAIVQPASDHSESFADLAFVSEADQCSIPHAFVYMHVCILLTLLQDPLWCVHKAETGSFHEFDSSCTKKAREFFPCDIRPDRQRSLSKMELLTMG